MMGDMAFSRRVPLVLRLLTQRAARARSIPALCAVFAVTAAPSPLWAQSALPPPAPTLSAAPAETPPPPLVPSAQQQPHAAPAPTEAPPGADAQPVPDTTAPLPVPPPYPIAPPASATDTAEDKRGAGAADSPDPRQSRPAPRDPVIYEPPLPSAYQHGRSDAPPPPVPVHVAPRTSLWLGVRPGVLFPLGSMWTDHGPVCCVSSDRPFSEFASAGPSIELNAGARLARRFQVYAFFDQAWLGSGSLEDEFGGQHGASTSAYGAGARFATHPDSWGLVVEMNVGYRTFEAEWENGTRLTASDDLFSTRVAFGTEWRLNRATTLALMLVWGGGAFKDVTWTFADGSQADALGAFDTNGSYAPLGLQLAAHWDVFGASN